MIDSQTAFAPIPTLAAGLRNGDFSSRDLTQFFLDRCEQLGPEYNAVVTVTRERSLAEADRAVPVRDRQEHGKVRLARPVLRSEPDPGHSGSDDRAVQEDDRQGAPDIVSARARARDRVAGLLTHHLDFAASVQTNIDHVDVIAARIPRFIEFT